MLWQERDTGMESRIEERSHWQPEPVWNGEGRQHRTRGRQRRRRHMRDDMLRLRPTPVQLLWGTLGLLIGIVATLVVLLLLAPEAPALVASPPATSDVAITLDDAALSNLTAEGLAQANLPFSVTNIHDSILPNDVVQITGDVPILGGITTRRLSATARLAVEQGHLVLHVSNATVGGFTLPAVVTKAIEAAFDARSASVTNSLNIDSTSYVVSGISSANGKLTIRLKRAT